MIAIRLQKVNEGFVRVVVSGALEHGSGTEEFRDGVGALFGKYTHVLCDFSCVHHVDGPGVQTLVASYIIGQNVGTDLEIINYADAIVEIHQLVKMLTVFGRSVNHSA